MSDETKGATEMVPGCRHDKAVRCAKIDGINIGTCLDCPALINMAAWDQLHPPPEPPKSWVRRRAEDTGQPEFCYGLMRETVEECCRVLKNKPFGVPGVEFMRHMMLEPKAAPTPTSVTADDQRRGLREPKP